MQAERAKKHAFVANALNKIDKFVWEKDISISLLEGKFELKFLMRRRKVEFK